MIPSVYVRQHQHRYKIPSLIQLHQITDNESNKLPPDISAEFYNLQWEFESVFKPAIRGYNGNFGPV